MSTTVQKRIRALRKENWHTEEISQILQMEGFKTPRGAIPDVPFVTRQINRINRSSTRPLQKVRTFRGLENYNSRVASANKEVPEEIASSDYDLTGRVNKFLASKKPLHDKIQLIEKINSVVGILQS